MRFVVILKQIPDDSIKKEYQDVDQLNDSDKNVIKEALDLRDRYGGTVDAVSYTHLSRTSGIPVHASKRLLKLRDRTVLIHGSIRSFNCSLLEEV